MRSLGIFALQGGEVQLKGGMSQETIAVAFFKCNRQTHTL